MAIEEEVFLLQAIGLTSEDYQNQDIQELMETEKDTLYDDIFEENDYRQILMSFLNVLLLKF